MAHVVRSIADVLRVARTDLEAVIVLKVNVEVANVHALLQTGNVIQMFVGIVGSVAVMVLSVFPAKGAIIMNAEI